MNYAVALICLQALVALLFAPVRIKLHYHFSLNQSQSNVVLKILYFSVLRIKIGVENDALAIIVNGNPKPLKHKKSSNGFPVEKIPKIVTYLRAERIIAFSYLLAYIGGSDAMNCALRFALVRSLGVLLCHNSLTLPDYDNDRLDFDLNVKGSINLYQVLELSGLIRSKKLENI